MKLSTRGRYGVRAMVDLAGRDGNRPVSLKDIAARQGVSVDYLEQLLRRLRKAGLVRSVRGPRGGFVLGRGASEINLWDVISAVEQDVTPVFCVNAEILGHPVRKTCDRAANCPTRPVWIGLAQQVRTYLESQTLQLILENSRKLGSVDGAPEAYCI